jgi:putative sterol carrier protein
MQAFMAGKVRIQGDMTKLMMAQGQGGSPGLSEALQSITA